MWTAKAFGELRNLGIRVRNLNHSVVFPDMTFPEVSQLGWKFAVL